MKSTIQGLNRRMQVIYNSDNILTCKYCDFEGKNSNSHSGHMAMCSERLQQKKTFYESIQDIILDENLALDKWNSWDHTYLQIHQYENRFSQEAIDFVLSQLSSFNEFPEQRIRKYMVFYLIVIAQIGATKIIRKNAFQLVTDLIGQKGIAVIQRYWKQIGSRKYEPSSENFFKNWARLIKIKDDLFFNVDFPSFPLLLDQYIISYKGFGWQWYDGDKLIFMDVMLNNIRDLMYLEQECAGVPSKYIRTSIPKDTLAYLHRFSRDRFKRDNSHYVQLEKMAYDPRCSSSAEFV